MEDTTFSTHTRPIHIDMLSPHPGWGMIGVSPCPGRRPRDDVHEQRRSHLELDLMCIRDWKAEMVLTVLDECEVNELGLSTLPERARHMGMAWHHLSIRRRYPPGPAFEHAWPDACREATDLLRAGKRVLIHCNEGLARAWTVAACLLVECGMSPTDALDWVRTGQPRAVPSALQEWYVLNYCRQAR